MIVRAVAGGSDRIYSRRCQASHRGEDARVVHYTSRTMLSVAETNVLGPKLALPRRVGMC